MNTLIHKDHLAAIGAFSMAGGDNRPGTIKSDTHILWSFDSSFVSLPDGVDLGIQTLSFPELGKGEEIDLAALYASVDWTKPVQLPVELFSMLRASQSVDTGMGDIYFEVPEGEPVGPFYIRKMSARDFMDLFPEDVSEAITGGSLQNAGLRKWFDYLLAGEVWLDYPGLDDKLQSLVDVIPGFTQEVKDKVMLGKLVE